MKLTNEPAMGEVANLASSYAENTIPI